MSKHLQSIALTFAFGIVALAVGAAAIPSLAPGVQAEAAATPQDSGFRLVARVRADAWTGLATAPATPPAGEDLAGPALLAALRKGGHVIYFRHARTDFSQQDSDLSDLANCATQRNLSEEGREQSRLIGESFAALGIPVGAVLSSELCRTRETAELAFGRATPTPDLTSFGTAGSEAEEQARAAALRDRLATPPGPGVNTVIVGHLFNIQAAANVGLAEGEAAIFLPLGSAEPGASPIASPRPT